MCGSGEVAEPSGPRSRHTATLRLAPDPLADPTGRPGGRGAGGTPERAVPSAPSCSSGFPRAAGSASFPTACRLEVPAVGCHCRPRPALPGRVTTFQKSRELPREPSHTHTHKRLLGSPLSTLWGGVGQAAADRKPRGAATHFGVDSVSHDCLHGWGRTTTGSTAFRRHRLHCRPLSRAATAPLPQRGEESIGRRRPRPSASPRARLGVRTRDPWPTPLPPRLPTALP